ncbi:MAG TPA: CBS domain-containing protein [Acidimicrobiia bacterium]|jgi:signal-transduction protein with cAMP-binding, CBS, and nucleotidyltransferase domain
MRLRDWTRLPHHIHSAAESVSPGSPVAALVRRPTVEIEGIASIAEAARLMRVEGVSALVVDRGRAVVTERDISRGIGAGADPDEPVSTVATPGPIIVDGSMSVAMCAGLLLNEQMRHVLVSMPDGGLGVVSLRDVAAVLLRHVDPQAWAPIADQSLSEIWLG